MALSGRRGRQEIDIAAACNVKAVTVFTVLDSFLPYKRLSADGAEQIKHGESSDRDIFYIIQRRDTQRKEKFGIAHETC